MADVTKLLGLEDVPWDEEDPGAPLGEVRIYHFDGFYLRVRLEILPAGLTPGNWKEFRATEEQLRRDGVRWLAHQSPFVRIDNLTDPKARMTKYGDGVSEGWAARGRARQRAEQKK